MSLYSVQYRTVYTTVQCTMLYSVQYCPVYNILQCTTPVQCIQLLSTDKSHCLRDQAELFKFAQCDISNGEMYNY